MSQRYSPSRMIIIGGGVGPLAGVDLHRLIIEQTKTDGKDQDHLRVLHLSCSDLIPDRTDSLLQGNPEAPALGMARILKAAESCCDEMFMQGYVGIPCNTFHSPAIWDRFKQALKESGSHLQVLNMIESTIEYMRESFPEITKIGLMSTTGTRETGVYSDSLHSSGYTVLESAYQNRVHDMIYHTEWGIKAKIPVSQEALQIGIDTLDELIEKGAEAVILGCTELPLALTEDTYKDIPLINPVRLLAKELIRKVQ